MQERKEGYQSFPHYTNSDHTGTMYVRSILEKKSQDPAQSKLIMPLPPCWPSVHPDSACSVQWVPLVKAQSVARESSSRL